MLCFFSASSLEAGKEFQSYKPVELTWKAYTGTLHSGFSRAAVSSRIFSLPLILDEPL